MRMMPRAAPWQCALCMRIGHVELRLVRAQERLRLNWAWKLSIIYTWLVKTLHKMLLLLNFLLLSSCALRFYCTLTSLLSLSQCCQPSAAFSTRLRKTCTLRRTSHIVLPFLDCQEAPFFPVLHKCIRELVHVTHEFIYVYVSANWHSWAWQTRTYVHCENRSLIQSLALMCSAIICSTFTMHVQWCEMKPKEGKKAESLGIGPQGSLA